MNELERLAELLTKKRQIDSDISSIIRRPSLPSHIGEFIASRIFGIKLEVSATAKGIDGVFVEGPLNGKTVNVKLYGKQEGILDVTTHSLADYYLVLTGPKSPPVTSRGATRPLVIDHVNLFEMRTLVKSLTRALKYTHTVVFHYELVGVFGHFQRVLRFFRYSTSVSAIVLDFRLHI